MTLKSKLTVGLLMLVFFAMTSSSFAQVNIQIITDPSAGEAATNRNAQTASPGVLGDGILISGQLVASSPLTATVLRLTFPGPITSSPANCIRGNSTPLCNSVTAGTGLIPTADPIRIEGATGVFATATIRGLNTTNSRIEVNLPGDPANTLSGSFRIVGVRIDANGKTGAQSVTPSLDSAANNYILTTTSAVVISAISPGVGTFAIGARTGTPSSTSLGTGTIFTNRTLPDATGSLILGEGFASAFRTTVQNSNSGTGVTNSTQVRLTFNGVPAGVTLTLATNPATGGIVAGLSNTTITATANTTLISFTSTSLTTTDTVEIDYTIQPLSTTSAVTTPGTITATATLYPIGDGVTSADSSALGLPREDQGYPSFAQADVGPITVVNIVPASTTLLIPLAEKVSTFDTGISIANTTADPFGLPGGGAVASAGTLKFDFFPSTATGAGTPCTLTTSATARPGAGIASDGTIPAGATYLVLLSQLLPLSNCAAGDFYGYIFVSANFLNAHGAATISDFRTYSLASPVLVLAPPSTNQRAAPAGNVESLNN